ncbi:MAG: 2-succinyl-6-hydroxy-2,4-cyclohexadiene-1-carboxylate synthase [Oscillatoria sp. SIO1A7]|nr:2-succinyl-6-hydroxy-2,4-cyclohexadiene-1-carboxylate synthase [Oscillatoria sp. SIO1A7]
MPLYYSLNGSKTQPVLLLLHGFMGNSNDYREVIPQLSAKFCCLAVDLPGHGQTKIAGEDDRYSMPNTARALISLLDELEIERCFLAAYSMGGRLALYLLLHFPERFEKAVLESASPGLKTAAERELRRQRDRQLAEKLETGDFQEFLLNWYRQPLFQSSAARPDFEELIARRLENNPHLLAKSLRNMGTGNQPSLWEKLADNKVPLLLLVGEKDDKFRAINTEMAGLSPLARMAIAPNTGHNIHFENHTYYVEILNFEF